MLVDALEFACPYCGETNSVAAEPDDAGQRLTQDCQVCCQPIEILLPADTGQPLRIRREDE